LEVLSWSVHLDLTFHIHALNPGQGSNLSLSTWPAEIVAVGPTSQKNVGHSKYKHINVERYNGGMERLQVPPLTEKQLEELEELYHKTKTPRYRTRAQMVLLSAEKGLKAEDIAPIVRESYVTVLRWLKRYMAEGIQGLMDDPRPGRSTTVTEDYRAK
jgi:hypothetical protein